MSIYESLSFFFFFFNDTATTEIYTLSLHDALPIFLDSTSALDLEDVPKRLLVLGGGIIGLEMATVYHALGAEITVVRSEEHTSELQSQSNLVCRLLLEKKKITEYI